MLKDNKAAQERWARRKAQRQGIAPAFGQFIAGLASWDWFVTITFRNAVSNPHAVVAAIKEWLANVEMMASARMGYLLAEEFGGLGGRFHCHLLVAGVAALRRDFWWREAFRRFGRTEIKPFNPEQGAAYYAAKYAAKSLGNLHFGGAFRGCEVRREENNFELKGVEVVSKRGSEVVSSDALPRDFFHMGLGRWHR
ncbi:MAG: rolling circle replication-associated protein [Terriglobia bacterium]